MQRKNYCCFDDFLDFISLCLIHNTFVQKHLQPNFLKKVYRKKFSKDDKKY